MTTGSRQFPTLISPRLGLVLITITLVAITYALIQIKPEKEQTEEAGQSNDLPVPLLNSTEELAAWHGKPIDAQYDDDTDSREQLIAAWNRFCGKFSPLPTFDELPATFRIRSLAAGYGEGSTFTIAISSEWDGETIAGKLDPFRSRVSTLATHRVDINRMENGVLVETHEINPTQAIYILRHGSWLIATNSEANIPVLAQAALEQQTTEKQEITPATYTILNEILISYGIDGSQESPDEE